MTWPAGLPLITVQCRLDLPVTGGLQGSPGKIEFISTQALVGTTDDSVVPPFTRELVLAADGTGSIVLPACNAPTWTPQGWSYLVRVIIANGVNWIDGIMTLNYNASPVQFADKFQPNGTATPGVSYIPLSLLGQPNGVPKLDGSGNLTLPTITATTSLSATAIGAGSIGADSVGTAVLTVAGVDFRLTSAPPNPVDQGLAGWTFDPAMSAQTGTILPTAGQAQVVRFRALATTISAFNFYVTAGGTGLANCRAALFNDAGALLGAGAVTGDLSGTGSGGWGDIGYKTCPLNVAQGVVQWAWYRCMFWANGGVLPTFARGSALSAALTNANMTAPTLRFSTADTGLTTTPPGNIGAQSASANAWWVGVKP
jgi:hypothetical protein